MTSFVPPSLLQNFFGTAAMRDVFGDASLLRRYVEVEAALARAQGKLGVIPADAAAAIDATARSLTIDMDRLREETLVVGYPILPLVRQLSAHVGPPGEYVHWGATTQDIMDTGLVLQIRDALDQIEAGLGAVRASLAGLASRHRDTIMAGRTHLQHALPVTFGYKAAVWLSMCDRHAERLRQVRERALIAQLSGAAGTLASLDSAGLAVQKQFAEELGLAVPAITWHTARDTLVEVVQLLGLIAGTLGKIGYDVMLLMMTEIGEVFEPFVPFRGASSTMPQKRNPISSELLLAAAKAVREQCGLMLDGMVQDLERATGPWHAEWIALPEAFILTAGALAQADFMLAGLEVDAVRMRDNLDMTSGLIMAEAVMMGLARSVGRQTAHDLVYAACREVVASQRPLTAVLKNDKAVSSHLTPEQIDELCDPANYLGAAGAMVDALLAQRALRD